MSKVICFDTETTGLNPDADEILQISVIDGDGKCLLNSYVKPETKTEWPEAEKINHITPAMVAEEPTKLELQEKVKEIFDSADTWISYNGVFDLRFLSKWGIEASPEVTHIDVMKRFADYYKEEDPRFPGEYKWKKLTFAAEHFGFGWEENAHDSLGDVKATLFVNQKLDEIETRKPRLFVDMDGTLAVFNPVVELETLYEQGYFLNLRPHRMVVDAVKNLLDNEEIEVFILSSVLTDSSYAENEKRAWLDKYLPEIDDAHRIFVPCGKAKSDYISFLTEKDFLLDDYTKNLNEWDPPGRGVKLMNGINGTKGTWNGVRVDYEDPQMAERIMEIIKEKKEKSYESNSYSKSEGWSRENDNSPKHGGMPGSRRL